MQKLKLELITPLYIKKLDLINALEYALENWAFVDSDSNCHVIKSLMGGDGEFVIINGRENTVE